MSEGTARIVDKASVEMVTDGPCLAGTLEQLEGGVGAKPMPAEALGKSQNGRLGTAGQGTGGIRHGSGDRPKSEWEVAH